MSRFHFKLRQNGIAKGFGGYASAIRNKKYAAIGHLEKHWLIDVNDSKTLSDLQLVAFGLYNQKIISIFAPCPVSSHSNNNKLACRA